MLALRGVITLIDSDLDALPEPVPEEAAELPPEKVPAAAALRSAES